jgi:transcriptional regulator with GAF, ATPase, and Fis domain/Tfp pilus assembly protein PilF
MLAGRYRVTGTLARGGQGEALAATDTWCADLPVVLKRVAWEARAALTGEFAALRSLVHPALVEARDLFDDDGNTFLVEARVSGEPLVAWAQGRGVRAVAAALAQVAHALAHLHARELVHLDVSPNNILADRDRATLIDLGLARATGRAGAAGTPGFVAPEVLAGEPASGAADVYGLAATLATALGAELRPGREVASLADLDDSALRELLASCLHDTPASRPSALALARRLAELGGAKESWLDRPLTRLSVCGRRHELDRFEQWLATGRGLLEISGAPGIGKSAFLGSCADRARCAGFLVLELAASGDGAIQALVSQAIGLVRGELPEVLAHDIARMIDHPRLPQASGRRPGLTAHECADVAVVTLDALAGDRPVLVLVDDAGSAGEAVERALSIWRERHVEHGARVLAATTRETPFRLEPLDVDGVGEMLRLAYAEPRPRAEAEHLVQLVGGRPRELVAAFAEMAQNRLVPLEVTEVPERVEGLPEALAPLACAVEPVPEPAVRALLAGRDDGASLLRDAVRAGQLHLAHAAYGIAYRVPESVRRASRSSRRGADLAAAFENAGLPLAAAAVWASAGEVEHAVELLEAAHEKPPEEMRAACAAVAAAGGSAALPPQAAESWAFHAAAVGALGEVETAAAALEELGAGDDTAVLVGACLVRLGRYPEAVAAVAGNDGDGARAVRARALYFSGRAREAREAAGEWSGAAGEARGDLLDVLGHSAFSLGDLDGARDLLERALSEAEAAGDVERLARARHGLAIVAHRSGDLERARVLYRTALEQAGVLARVSRTVNFATLLQDLGELAEARSLYEDALSWAVALANRREQARVGVNLANLYVQLGDLPAAVRLAEETLELCDETGLSHPAAMAALVLAEAQIERGDLDAAAAALDRAARYLEEIDDRAAESELQLLRARVAAASGEHEAAQLHLAEVETAAAGHLERQVAYWRVCFALAAGAPPDRALREHAKRAVDLARGDRELVWRARAVRARVLERAGDPGAASARRSATTALDTLIDSLPAALRHAYLGCGSRRDLAGWLRHRPPVGATSTPGTVAYRRILAINRRLAREHEVEPLLELIVDAATELLGAERGFLLLRGDGTGVRVAVARNFDRRSLEDGSQRISRSIANECLRTGEAILTTNAQQDHRFASSQSVAALKVRSVVCVPLRGTARDEDPQIGALYLDHRFQDRAFTADDVELCESFADQVAIALENAGLLERTRDQERRLAAQNERLERLNEQLQREAAQYAEEAEAALRRLREEGPTVGVGRGFERIVGSSDRLREALRLVDRFADTDVPVVIRGESGTGKELIARAIHERSSRRERAFVSINCGAIPENLIESELFGYRRGAFTGAVRDKPGLVRAAEGGTLLLDEVGEMPLAMQVKLLRVLQEKEYRPVGATASLRADVRVVSASHADLEGLVAAGRFREDLFYRLRVVEIPVPPLRERRQDVPLLADHFCRQVCGAPAEERFTREALACLLGYDWPGNVRELENEVRRALALADDWVDIDSLSERLRGVRAGGAAILADTARGSLREIVDGFERQVLLATLKRTRWNVRQAAAELGLSRAALYTRLKRFGISREEHSVGRSS